MYKCVSPNRSVPNHNLEIKYNGRPIKKVNHIKLLGVDIDSRLSFTTHSENLICKRLRRYVPILLQLRKFLPIGHLLKIYHANINSLISYCILVFHSGNLTNIKKIRCMQQRILKILFKTQTSEVDKYMKRYNLLKVTETYIFKLLCIGHKMVYNHTSLPQYLQNVYKNKENIKLRNNKDFIVPFHRLAIAQNSLDYKISKMWSKLPIEIKNISRYNSFVKQIKKIIINGLYKEYLI